MTPQLKIEEGYWYVSQNNGVSWTRLGKATGEEGNAIFESVTQDDDYVYFVLADGGYVYLHNGNCIDFNYDLNGPKPPNEFGKDIYKFLLCSYEQCNTHTWYTGTCGKFVPNGMKSQNREEALEKCKDNNSDCSELLLIDGFEFKKDYPYRL